MIDILSKLCLTLKLPVWLFHSMHIQMIVVLALEAYSDLHIWCGMFCEVHYGQDVVGYVESWHWVVIESRVCWCCMTETSWKSCTRAVQTHHANLQKPPETAQATWGHCNWTCHGMVSLTHKCSLTFKVRTVCFTWVPCDWLDGCTSDKIRWIVTCS
jgi:hypothetical protein